MRPKSPPVKIALIQPHLVVVQMDNFFKVITNPNVLVQFPHVFLSGLVTAGFFVLGISAWHLLRNTPQRDFFERSARIAVFYGLIGIVGVILVGHTQAQHMVETRPMKMAAAEGLFETEDPASFSLLTIGDMKQREEVFAIRIPRALSLLAYNSLDGEVKGINNLQEEYEGKYGALYDYRPPIAVIYWSFRTMVGSGMLMLALAAFGVFLVVRNRFTEMPWFLKLLPYAILLPYVANTAGWLMTELGRQPWIVFGLQMTEQAVSPNVSTGMVALSLLLFTVVYGVLMAADLYLLAKYGRLGPANDTDDDTVAEAVPAAAA